jgi:hypothetical protein
MAGGTAQNHVKDSNPDRNTNPPKATATGANGNFQPHFTLEIVVVSQKHVSNQKTKRDTQQINPEQSSSQSEYSCTNSNTKTSKSSSYEELSFDTRVLHLVSTKPDFVSPSVLPVVQTNILTDCLIQHPLNNFNPALLVLLPEGEETITNKGSKHQYRMAICRDNLTAVRYRSWDQSQWNVKNEQFPRTHLKKICFLPRTHSNEPRKCKTSKNVGLQ